MGAPRTVRFDLRSWRDSRTLTINQAADALGIARTSIMAYEKSGETPVSVERLATALDALEPFSGDLPLHFSACADWRQVQIKPFNSASEPTAIRTTVGDFRRAQKLLRTAFPTPKAPRTEGER